MFEESAELHITIARAVLKPWARPDRLVCIRATGDSMSPTVRDGDLIALDWSRRQPVGGQLFVVRVAEGVVVKRLRRRGGVWHLVSDNRTYRLRRIGAADRIIGQIAWHGPPPTVHRRTTREQPRR